MLWISKKTNNAQSRRYRLGAHGPHGGTPASQMGYLHREPTASRSAAGPRLLAVQMTRTHLCTLFIACLLTLTTYAQRSPVSVQPALNVRRVEAKATASRGQALKVVVTFGVRRPIPTDGKVFLYFWQDAKLYLVVDHTPTPPSSRWPVDSSIEQTISVKLPGDLPLGSYQIEVGLHGQWTDRQFSTVTSSASLTLAGRFDQSQLPRKPIGNGCFIDQEQTPHRWHITHNNALIWDGEPWYPVGGMIFSRHMYFASDPGYPPETALAEFRQDEQEWQQVRKRGVRDVYLAGALTRRTAEGRDAPVDALQRVLNKLDTMGFRYGFEISSGPTQVGPPGFWVQLDDFRITGARHGKTYSLELPGQIGTAFYFVIDDIDGELVHLGKARIRKQDGKTVGQVTIEGTPGKSYTLKIVPQMDWRTSAARFNFWDGGYEEYEARLVDQLAQLKLGPNFRFFVDPFWNEFGIKPYYFYASAGYRDALKKWLKEKYTDVTSLRRAWAIRTGSLSSFEDASRLIPVCRGTNVSEQGIQGYAYDFNDETWFVLDAATTQMWYDLHEFRDRALQSCVRRVCQAIKKIHNAPVVMKRHWGSRRLFINESEVGGLDGLGMDSYGTGDSLARFNGAATYGDLAQSRRTQWCITTETSSCSLGQEFVGYPSRRAMYDDFGQLIHLGVKGIFSFGVILHATGGDGGWAACDMSRDPQQLEWLGSFGRMLRGQNDLAAYRPHYYYWYPTRDLDSLTISSFVGLSGAPHTGVQRSEQGVWIVPTYTPDVDTELLVSGLHEKSAVDRYGPRLQNTLAMRPSLRHVQVRTLKESLKIAAPAPPSLHPLKDVLRIHRLDAPPPVEAYGFMEANGSPTLFLWSTEHDVTVRIRSRLSRPFKVFLPNTPETHDVRETIVVALPGITRRPLRMGSVNAMVSDGVLPIEVHGLHGKDAVITLSQR